MYSKFYIFLISAIFVTCIFPHDEMDEIEIGKLQAKVVELEKRIQYLENLISNNSNKEQTFSDKWKNKSNWRKLKKGLPMNKVRDLLGEPVRITGGAITYWYYEEGEVEFINEKLYGWREPDFK